MAQRRRLLPCHSFDKYLSPSATPRGPQGGYLQGQVQSPSFNEEQAQHAAFIQDWKGDVGCEAHYFEEHEARPGGSTFVKGEMHLKK